MAENITSPKPFIFVLIPSKKSFKNVYELAIKEAANSCNAYAEKLDEQIFNEGMLDRIYNQINKADIIIADMSGKNENVFYEVGYAHALGKTVLLLTQNTDDIPFDLKHRQHIKYSPDDIQSLKTELHKRIEWALKATETQKKPSNITLFVNGQMLSSLTRAYRRLIVITPKKYFTLNIQIENNSSDTLDAITHIYMLTAPNSDLVPRKIITRTMERIMAKTGAIDKCLLAPVQKDRIEGKNSYYLYRLPIKFPAIPPGAMEKDILRLIFSTDTHSAKELFILRLHTGDSFYSFRFSVSASIKA
jgi:nucleoside 2-deoxyribosyltransferase